MGEEETSAVFSKKVAIAFYTLLILLGVLMYLGWGVFFGTWNLLAPESMGVYSIVVILLGFGITGVLLYSRR
ncbi:MAG: hypothetical protein KAW09_12635 [Thermoplasmata archaeon]|nr:hypothetical protein [Thermoplasmata archaeon]